MKKQDVQHFLGVYQIRKRLQDEGLSNPSEEIKKFTRDFVEKLSQMPPDKEVTIENNCFYDSSKNLIAKIPYPRERERERVTVFYNEFGNIA